MSIGGEAFKSRVISGMFWKFSERLGIQGTQFLVQILLARLLFPEDYAVVALTAAFIYICDVVVSTGFVQALIQRRDVDEEDLSSVFHISLAASTAAYAVLFAAAPLLAEFYGDPVLTHILRAQALMLFLGAFRMIQNTLIARTMEFRKSFVASTASLVASGAVGITLALQGYGAWALVFSQLAGAAASVVTLWLAVEWRPSLVFSLQKVGSLFDFGSKILYGTLLDVVYNNLRTLVIGRLFSKDILGYYNRGENWPALAVTSIDGTISAVLFPALSARQDDPEALRSMLRRTLVTSCFLVFPAMLGLAAVAEPLIALVLTEKWLGAVPFLQLSCLTYALWPFHTANTQAINAVGRSDIFLRLEVVKKGLGLALLASSVPFGAYAIVGSGIVMSAAATVINAWPNGRLINYPPSRQWLDVLPSLLLSLAMASVVWSMSLLDLSASATLAIQVLLGFMVYAAGAWLFRLECFLYLLENASPPWRRSG